MRATATPISNRKGKGRLLESCAIAAGLIALACGGPALAQVAGTGNVVSGGATISPPASDAPTNVFTSGPQSIIDWTPSNTPVGGVVDFLPAGNTLNFFGTGDYVVLNRFVSGAGTPITDQVALNGTVNGFNSSSQGGSIWFYNAGGILIGSTGVINVGSLLLTTNNIDTNGGLFGAGGEIRFRGTTSTSAVTVNGAINATNSFNPGSSYVALVAPRVVQAGNVRVDGSAAYVAAEQADIRINSGLFDINVTVGAEGGNVITHSGSTTGPAHQQGDTDQSRIYMVAIPKNDAVSMLVSGSIGYDDALSAQIDPDGAVRLSAGYNITGGELNAAPVNAVAANITVNDTLFRSNTLAHASGALVAQALSQVPGPPAPPPHLGRVFVEGNGTFIGDASATLTVGNGQVAGATGALTVQSGGTGGIPGNAAINVTGGTLSAPNAITIQASGVAQSLTGDSQGGTASLTITGGSVTTAGITVEANGVAAIGSNGSGGSGRGGSASITVSNAGSTLTAGNIFINALGTGVTDFGSNPAPAINGDGTGGIATLTVSNGGSVGPTTLLSLDAAGIGGGGLTQSGNGAGGTARIQVSGTGSFLSTTQSFVRAAGVGGGDDGSFVLTQNGGDGTGGNAELIVNSNANATVSLGELNLNALGRGGNASAGENATGGNAIGGTATATVGGGVTALFSNMSLSAAAQGGNGNSPSGTTGQSGNASAGTVNLSAANGSVIGASGDIIIFAGVGGASGENFGTGRGGDVTVSATSGGTISTATQMRVDAIGGRSVPQVAQSAGSRTGGNVDFIADGGTISADNFDVNASASVSNVSGTNGAALGGTIDLLASNAGQILSTGSIGNRFDVSGVTGISTAGSSATGGAIRLIANAGSIDLSADNVLIASGVSGGATIPGPSIATGTGGSILVRTVAEASNSSAINFGQLNASTNGTSSAVTEVPPGTFPNPTGNGQGGIITVDMQGGSLTGGSIQLSADGEGGATGTSTGRGGTAIFTQTGGNVTITDLNVSANGTGDVGTGQSGDGFGGTASINLLGGTISAADISATANGFGGFGLPGNDIDPLNPVAGGRGGAGRGGIATITIDGSAVVTASAIGASAIGGGGNGGDFIPFSSGSIAPGATGDGGDGTGGIATINLISGTVSSGNMIADATGTGGNGGSSSFIGMTAATGIGAGGRGGNGQGGTATVSLAAAANITDLTASFARGVGGNGGSHNVGGDGGNAVGGTAQAIVNNFNAGALAVTLDGGAQGGIGGDGSDGNGGNGGNAAGGTARARADGANANITMEQVSFITDGAGGAGGRGGLSFFANPAVAPTGGLGGNGRGGTLEIGADNGATVALTPDVNGNILLSSSGAGGTGGTGASNENAGGIGGVGGNAGTGQGGTVLLRANGGTISSNGNPVDIVANGTSGVGGTGGGGSAAPGADGATALTTGGRAVIEASAGQISLGNTSIDASGDNAGRIELRAGGNITMASLNATATGAALPTNNDTNLATTGIFLAATGGTIATTANMSLTTDGSIGVYAQGAGTVSAGTGLAMNAVDQIDIRHDQRSGTAPTIQAGDELTIAAGTSISGAAGSLLGSGATLSLAVTGPNGTITLDRLDGTNIVINSAGAASVEHAEADNDFTANAGSFRTGLNSIITGGDIIVSSPGAVDLGNSTAGGAVAVNGQSIAFNSIGAGGSVFLAASGTVPGAEGISGNIITSGGNVVLRSAGNVTIATSIAANGGAVDPNSGVAEGHLFVDAAGNATLTGASAASMVGVNAGQAVTITGGSAGEDLLILAGSTANLSNFTAGDDAEIRAPGAITAQNISTTGTGGDARALSLLSGSGFTINTAAADGADIILTSANGAIDAANLSAGDDILLTAATTLAVDGAATLGLGTTGGDSSIRTQAGDTTLGNLNAFDDIVAVSTGAVAITAPAAAGRDISIDAASVNVATLNNPNPGGGLIDTLDAGRNLQVTASGAITGGAVRADGNLALAAGTTIAISRAATGAGGSLTLDAADGVTAGTVASGGTTSLNSTGGTVSIDSLASSGAVDASGDSILIAGGSSGNLAFNQLNAATGDARVTNGGDITVASGAVAGSAALTSTGGAVSVQQLSANSVDLTARTNMTLGNVSATQGLTAQTGNMLTLAGAVTGRTMALTSGDITIGANGRAGTGGVTQTLQITNGGSRQTFIGGTGTRGGYHIDADEMARLFGTDIRIAGPLASPTASGAPVETDVIIDSFTMTGGNSASNFGDNGSLTIATPGKARVIGNVQLTGLADASALNLFADTALEVILGQGSVRLTGANNAPGGRLNMASDEIIVATLAAIADVRAATTTDAINTRLAENDGVTSDEGALFARGISADVGRGFYVQNSGAGTTFSERRGLTFGAGGLDVVTAGRSSGIVINGVQLGASGQVTGFDTLAFLTIAGAAPSGTANNFDRRSTLNGCLIAFTGACTTISLDPETNFPVQDVIDNPADPDAEKAEGNNLPTPLITMRDVDPLTGEPLLDDPVTGAGNDDLWTPPAQ